MDEPEENADLAVILSGLRSKVVSTETIWCTMATSFNSVVKSRRGLLLGGAWSPQFIFHTDKCDEVPFIRTLQRPHIIVTDSVRVFADWLPLLVDAAKNSATLLFVTQQIDEGSLRGLIMNSMRGTLNACVVRYNHHMSAIFMSVLGQPHQEPPISLEQLPIADEAWIRKDSSVLFFKDYDHQEILNDVVVIEVGGTDLDDQRLRTRHMSDLIRKKTNELVLDSRENRPQ